jgi:N-acetylglucosaminyldiphosphoundecaprenol N-acetyl-beta-D-mannosaminyltransferase
VKDRAWAKILGCRVDAVNCFEAINRIIELMHADEPSYVVTLGTEMIVRAQKDERFRAIINNSALSLCDTIGVLYAARLHDTYIHRPVTGVDLIEPLCAALAAEGLITYFLGAQGDTAKIAAASMRAAYPNLQIAGCRHGYFSPDADAHVAAEIAQSGAHMLFVGMGSPRQEYFIAEHLRETGCRVAIGVGGSFDVLAGNVRRAPQSMRRLGLEWLYRLACEPRRWQRQLALPRFVWLALHEAVTEVHRA